MSEESVYVKERPAQLVQSGTTQTMLTHTLFIPIERLDKVAHRSHSLQFLICKPGLTKRPLHRVLLFSTCPQQMQPHVVHRRFQDAVLFKPRHSKWGVRPISLDHADTLLHSLTLRRFTKRAKRTPNSLHGMPAEGLNRTRHSTTFAKGTNASNRRQRKLFAKAPNPAAYARACNLIGF